ncbi:MAG: hypothetical protein E7233_02875 [Lachnospiraceae bacterium]|nr:hypothetical protein [Lachnospiraceae bacterium]
MIFLQNGTLRVEIADPGEHPNDGVRFDRAGFITDVVLNNEIHFCGSENKNNIHKTTHGRGLCCEYKMDASSEADIGERYPKLGVGLVLKEKEGRYHFTEKYDIEYFPVEVQSADTWAQFVTKAVLCCGYAAEQIKRVSIEDNTLTVEYELKNVGEKEIVTDEYCHNFINIDGYAMSDDYILETPMMKDFGNDQVISKYTDAPSKLKACGKGFTFSDVNKDIILQDMDIEGTSAELPFVWKLRNKAAQASILAEDLYTPSALCIWTTDHVICPEFMHSISIKPGETCKWYRKMTFIDEEEDQ